MGMLKIAHHSDGSQRQVHLGGWKKQFHDPRDEAYKLKLPAGLYGVAPTSVDQRLACSPIEDQGDLGSCTANMLAGLVEFNEMKSISKSALSSLGAPLALPNVSVSNLAVGTDGTVTFTTTVKPSAAPAPTPTPAPTPAPAPKVLTRVSRLFEYYATRKIENTVSEDSGATIRDAAKAAAQYGVVDEAAWPYLISKFTVNPPTPIWTAAATHKVTSYHSIADGDLTTMKSVLASGYLIGFGFQVYSYFMSAAMASKAFLNVPASSEQLEGGHAVCLVGYDDNMVNPFNLASKGAFLVRNSWGTGWGQSGYFFMSYDYVRNTQLASDFWVIQSSPI
jgi:hypothetical protein